MEKKIIVAFDFDGTITRNDTFIEFIKFAKGYSSFFLGFILYLPIIIAFKIRLYPRWKAKQRIFSHFFKGMEYNEFCRLGMLFSERIERMIYPNALKALTNHIQQGNKIYIISASLEEWIKPWGERHNIHTIGTQAEIDNNGKLTGYFSTPNCNGKEKVNRLLEKEPLRNTYILYAYGDSIGDKELIEFSDKGWYNHFK